MTIAKARVRLDIILDEPVAIWLRDLMQNPLYDDETPEESRLRRGIFSALTHVDDRAVKSSQFIDHEDDIPW